MKLVPPPIKEPSPESAQSPDDSSDNEAEQLVQPAILGSDAVGNDLTKTKAAVMAERRTVFENRCGIMHMKIEEIQKVVATDRKSTRLNSSHLARSRMPSSA